MNAPRRGVYLLPSLLTLGNLSVGVLSMLFAASDHFTRAAWCLIVAILFDMLDGRIARWTRTTSQFGLELDSLADMISFGVAPAILMYHMALEPLGRPGIAIAIFFTITAAVRLARFNVKTLSETESSGFFTGLPTPAAAGILASFVLSYELLDGPRPTAKTISLLMAKMPLLFSLVPAVMLLLAFLMVSNVQYGNFKRLKLGRSKSLQGLIFIVAGVLWVMAYPQNTIFILATLYVLSGLVTYLWRLRFTARQRRDGPEAPAEGAP